MAQKEAVPLVPLIGPVGRSGRLLGRYGFTKARNGCPLFVTIKSNGPASTGIKFRHISSYHSIGGRDVRFESNEPVRNRRRAKADNIRRNGRATNTPSWREAKKSIEGAACQMGSSHCGASPIYLESGVDTCSAVFFSAAA